MAPSYDLASSALLCAEDSNCILGFGDVDEDDGDDDEGEHEQISWLPEQQRCHFYGDSLMDLAQQSDDCLAFLMERESEHMPREDYAERLRSGALDLSIRRDAIDWIMKVHAHYNFGPLSAYLSVNYLDRFLSNYELPKGKAWMTQLLSVACLSLAAKMEETEVPLSLDLQVGEAKYIFEARTIQRMELLVLSTLKWRMQAVTPFSYINFFIRKFSVGNVAAKVAVSQSIQLILSIIGGTNLLAFRSSEIALAVSLLVLGETQIVDVEQAVSCCAQVVKERVIRCYEVIKDMEVIRNVPLQNDLISVSSVPQSPMGVLDAACLSYNSDDRAAKSHEACHGSTSASKRRKINMS
ncbi:cyclin-D4-1-like [Canna indica]|uniref:Cyclin-D4-1-like n=1 Tax=Canna indica TaxID=4628 RepID=A0AAQ3KMK4_9LILI|nr:cyclin-D4-1-like [Canna indica]